MSKLETTIGEIWGHKPVKGEVGIEVELEGKNILRNNIDPYWVYHVDNSLRGEENGEFVLGKPVDRKVVPEALNSLFNNLKNFGSKIRRDSPNTSVHVHLNMQRWSVKKTMNLICLWHVFEHLLVDWCGEERSGNLFCLRGSDAEAGLQRLAAAVRYGKWASLNDQDGLRYSACNFTSLGKFGSLEFRSLAGIYDEDVINQWVEYLLSLKDYAETFDDPSDIILEFSRAVPEEFARNALGKRWGEVCRGDFRGHLLSGTRLIQHLAYTVDWKKKPDVDKKDYGDAPEEVNHDRDLDVVQRWNDDRGRAWLRLRNGGIRPDDENGIVVDARGLPRGEAAPLRPRFNPFVGFGRDIRPAVPEPPQPVIHDLEPAPAPPPEQAPQDEERERRDRHWRGVVERRIMEERHKVALQMPNNLEQWEREMRALVRAGEGN